jgi:hypothetical protein
MLDYAVGECVQRCCTSKLQLGGSTDRLVRGVDILREKDKRRSSKRKHMRVMTSLGSELDKLI